MGDPETQPIMARLKTDLVTVMEHAVNGTLDAVTLEWDRRVALGVVMAAAGYPDAPRKGDVITGIPEETPEAVTFHAGTTLSANTLTVNGGRVLCVVGLGDSVKMAQKQAYAAVDRIHFDGAQFRRDIGWRAIRRHG
jgi:phosphoribosylamine--glycine ligase